MSFRQEKINKLLKRYLAEAITREINWKPGVFLTVVAVDTSSDLRYTRAFVSVFPEQETNYALKTLQKERRNLQNWLKRKITFPYPCLSFQIDYGESKIEEVQKLLDQV